MPAVASPHCGEADELGGEDIEGIATSTREEAGRAGVPTPSGIRLVADCWSCRGDDVTSSDPMPGPRPPPGRSRDLRALPTGGT